RVPGAHVAEALGVPGIAAYLQPATPTRAFPSIRAGGRELGPVRNLLSHLAAEHLMAQPLLGPLNTWRDAIGLDRLPRRRPRPRSRDGATPVLYGYSPSVLPRPADWHERVHVCGHWSAPAPPWTP